MFAEGAYMKIVDGVYLHFLKTDKFKTNQLTCRFSGRMDQDNRARRALVGQMLATANASYPTSQAFRRRLASLYGAHLGTSLSTKGLLHLVDIDINFVANDFAIGQEDVLGEVLTFFQEVLFHPLARAERYQKQVFETEQVNLINYLEADREDLFYYSDLELDKLYFEAEFMQVSKYSSPEQVGREDAYTAFQEFRRMLNQDRIDIFISGHFDEYKILQRLHQFSFQPREVDLSFQYQQDFSNVTREKLEKRETSQSILQLGYHVPVTYQGDDCFTMMVINGSLGLFPHSLLFTQLREKEGLAYTIGSQFNPYQQLLKIYAGIDRSKRQQTLQLITKQLNHLKSGRFTMDLVNKTKKMLINGSELVQDSHKAMIEMAYNKLLLEDQELTLFREGIESVTKKDIIALAKNIRLQAVYFMEGED